jgi:hypothetical protein
MLVWPVIVILVLVVWLSAGRRLALLLDPLVSGRSVSLPAKKFVYDGGGLVVGDKPMTFGKVDNLRADIELPLDSSNRVVLTYGGKSFVLGPLTAPPERPGRPDFFFTAEPGDEVSFSSSESLLPWPTVFDISWLGGSSPWMKQYVYYRLVWKKPSGARLEMRWRYERQLYSGKG